MNKANFEYPLNDKSVQLFHIFSNNISCYLTNYGARVVSLQTLDKSFQKVDVVLGFDSLDGYLNASEKYHGATIGRFANRIANGSFKLDNKTYTLQQNNNGNSLHGGVNAFHNSVWNCVSHNDSKVVFTLKSPHMDEGFPGDLNTQVTYSIQGSTLKIDYRATSSEDTFVNFTHHSYFNLNGEGSGTVLNHLISINSEYFTPINENCIPTGSLSMVTDTPFDFTTKKTIGSEIDVVDEQLKYGNGYDHNFVLNQHVDGDLNLAAQVVGDRTNIKMEVWSTEPGVQFYTGNHLDGTDKGKSGEYYAQRTAFCLETQHFPDSPNQPNFPTTLIKANQLFQSTTEYRFSII